MDNNSTHIDEVIISAIEAEGHIVRFLPPYSPDFNPIELSFSVLKAWFQRNYVWTRSNHRSFRDYLIWAIGQSRCDRFAREQFRHSANGLYLEEGELKRLREWLRVWEQETVEMGVEDWIEEELAEAEC
jgi:transposase